MKDVSTTKYKGHWNPLALIKARKHHKGELKDNKRFVNDKNGSKLKETSKSKRKKCQLNAM